MPIQPIPRRAAGALATAALLGVSGAAVAIDAEISGHVNRAIMVFDDGEDSETAFVDGEPSNSRVRFRGTGELGNGLTAGVYGEWELVSNNSSQVTIDDTDPSGSEFEVNERHMDAFIQGGFGKLSLGQGDGAANGIAETDLSGTAIINYAGAGDLGGSIVFRDDGVAITDASGDEVTIGGSYSQFDFESRFDRVRYDTPAFGPLQAAIGFGTKDNNDVTDAALRYSGEFAGGAELAAGLGYSTESRGGAEGSEETFGGSASLLLPGGLNFTAVYTRQENDADLDADTFYGKVGYRVGRHAVSVDYGITNDLVDDDSEGEVYGVGYVFTPVNWAELYAGVKQHSLDLDGGSDPDDIVIATAGTRLKF
ncbi:porin [Spiribacter halobius]|uniref:Porin domain-containing protein n=1 Tax=Sediminicurvatus halobius TaxID=2182432 RepID=A0A2U2N0G8_9GAMM|nr:porin [Spiribacter halobius]PWG62558.1 hypothetical protein DEM34_11440 [Spiribacter halobius]UEX78528.1 porin [Spiribacter halobius]